MSNRSNNRTRLALCELETREVPAVGLFATGAGPGGGPQVNVYNPDGSLRFSYYAFNAPTFGGGVRVATGDINGDGWEDAIAAAGPGGGPRVEVRSGLNGAVLRDFFAYDPAYTGS